MFHFTTNPPYPEYRQSVAQKYAKISKCKTQTTKLSSQTTDFPQFSRITPSTKQIFGQNTADNKQSATLPKLLRATAHTNLFRVEREGKTQQ